MLAVSLAYEFPSEILQTNCDTTAGKWWKFLTEEYILWGILVCLTKVSRARAHANTIPGNCGHGLAAGRLFRPNSHRIL